MKSPPRLYTRLTRTWPGLLGYRSLWLAEDHLLQVTSNGFTEKYQRFYFRDIKGLLVSQSGTFGLTNGIAGSLTLLSGVPLLYSLSVDNLSVISLVFFVPSLVILLTNLILGKTCRIHILTGIQTEPLRVLSRVRRANAALAKLEPRIQAAQIGLVPPTIATPVAVESVPPVTESAVPAASDGAAPPPAAVTEAPPPAAPESPSSP